MTPELLRRRPPVSAAEVHLSPARAARDSARSDTSRPVALHSVGTHAVRLADRSLRAVLEWPTLPVPLPQGDRGWLAVMDGLLDQLDHPFQLVVQRRLRQHSDHAARVNPVDPAVRLRDSYERLLAAHWPDRPVRRSRFYVTVSSPASIDEHAQAAALEGQVRAAIEVLRRAGIETARVPAEALVALVATFALEELRCEVRFADDLARPLRIGECPTLTSSDWLAALCATDADLDVTIHARPRAPMNGGQRAVSADLLVILWATDRAQLDEATSDVERALAARVVRTRRCAFQAEAAFVSALPLGLDQAGGWRGFSVRTLAALLSASWSGDVDRDRGLLCGVEPGSGRPLLLDRDALADRAEVVLGTANAGQSSVLKVEAARARVAGAAVTAIDADGDLAQFVAALGGTVIRVDPRAAAPFDAFAVPSGRPGALSSRIACLMAAIELLAGGLTDHQAWALEHALSYVYALRGHTDDGDTTSLAAPLAGDVVAALRSQSARAFGEVKAQIDGLERVLAAHVSGSDSRLLLGPAAPHPGASVLAYDLSGVPAEDRPAAALLALDHACRSAWDGRRCLVLLDEMAGLTRHPRAAALLAGVMETAGVHGIGLRLATTGVAGLLRSPARRLVADGHLKVVLRQAPADLPALAELLHLTPAEQSWLLAAHQAEGLLVTPEQRLAFELVMTEEERRLITQGAKP